MGWLAGSQLAFLIFGQRIRGSRAMAVGIVKWFNSKKGYGFIQPDDGAKDVFVHISAVERAGLPGLNEGQRIEYDLATNTDGKVLASNLKLA